MDMIRDYLAMGGYAPFVWPAYALSIVLLIGLLVASLRRLRRSEAALAEIGATRSSDDETRP